MSLLQEALSLQKKQKHDAGKVYTAQQVELALAWLKDEVSYTPVKVVMELGEGSNVYNFLAVALREAYRRGLINIDGGGSKGK
jgi:hypothetical protein